MQLHFFLFDPIEKEISNSHLNRKRYLQAKVRTTLDLFPELYFYFLFIEIEDDDEDKEGICASVVLEEIKRVTYQNPFSQRFIRITVHIPVNTLKVGYIFLFHCKYEPRWISTLAHSYLFASISANLVNAKHSGPGSAVSSPAPGVVYKRRRPDWQTIRSSFSVGLFSIFFFRYPSG